MSYLQWEASLPRHHKTLRLARELGVSRREAIGVISDLWAWVLQTRPSGMLDGISDAELEAVLEWTGADGQLVAALVTSRWLDRTGDGSLEVHGWMERAASYRKAAAEKTRRGAAKAAAKSTADEMRGPRVDHGGARVAHARATVAHEPARVDHGGSTVGPPCPREERRGEEQRGAVVLSKAEVGAPRPAEAAGSTPAPVPESPVVARLPMKGRQTQAVTEAHVARWREAYPGVDVQAEVSKMLAWLDANPTKRPQSNGLSFAVRWLGGAQNDAARRASAQAQRSPDRAPAPRRNAQQDAVEAMVAWTLEARGVPPMPDDPDPPPQGALVLRPTSAGYTRAAPVPHIDPVELFLEGEWSMRPSEALAAVDPTEVLR